MGESSGHLDNAQPRFSGGRVWGGCPQPTRRGRHMRSSCGEPGDRPFRARRPGCEAASRLAGSVHMEFGLAVRHHRGRRSEQKVKVAVGRGPDLVSRRRVLAGDAGLRGRNGTMPASHAWFCSFLAFSAATGGSGRGGVLTGGLAAHAKRQSDHFPQFPPHAAVCHSSEFAGEGDRLLPAALEQDSPFERLAAAKSVFRCAATVPQRGLRRKASYRARPWQRRSSGLCEQLGVGMRARAVKRAAQGDETLLRFLSVDGSEVVHERGLLDHARDSVLAPVEDEALRVAASAAPEEQRRQRIASVHARTHQLRFKSPCKRFNGSVVGRSGGSLDGEGGANAIAPSGIDLHRM